MSLDPSQLTLPQIAAAVAAGKLELAEAEAELRRRPAEVLPRRPRAVPAPRPPSAVDVLRALEETRRALRQTTRHLAQLSERIEGLSRLAAALPDGPRRPTIAGRPESPETEVRSASPGRRRQLRM